MQFTKSQNNFIIRLEKGEPIVDTLLKFSETNKIHSAMLHGIGGALSAELGFYNLQRKEYFYKEFGKLHEIVSLTGNIATVDNKPFLHIHAVLSDENFNCFGGHLKEGVVGATCEIYLYDPGIKIERKYDEGIGLKLLDCAFKPS